ncbi:MAG TPA: tripartite tricarboxylate transporter substrate binding protein [Burkholderiales bacterium]|jgi:tripartite-type tricarboxylate transporter receptor subunit TctC
MSIRVLLAALLLCSQAAWAQYPTRSIRLIVPFPPAGATDIVGRIVAQKLSERLGQSVVVENRPGAGGTLGSDVVAKSAPDGYTILIATTSTHSIGPVLQKLPYDPIKDFAAITQVANIPNVLVVSPKLPVKTLQEFIALARSQPGKLNYSSSGIGTVIHLEGELFKLLAKVDLVHVPYKGTALALPDLANGNVAMMVDNMASALPNIHSGNVRPLAVEASKRSPLLPEVPTFAEAGMPEFDLPVWFGMFAPADTPREIVERLQREVVAGLAAPDVRERFRAVGAEPVGNTPAEFVERIRRDAARWSEVIKAANVKAQ